MSESQGAINLLEGIRQNSKFSIGVGIVFLIAGIFSIGSPALAGVSVTVVIGAILAVSGIAQCVAAVKMGVFGRGLFAFVLGVLTLMLGGYMLMQPVAGMAVLTLTLAAFFIASGLLEGYAAFQMRGLQGAGWLAFNSIVSFVLGALIWAQFPLSGLWAIGTLLGVRLLMTGWTLLFVGITARKIID